MIWVFGPNRKVGFGPDSDPEVFFGRGLFEKRNLSSLDILLFNWFVLVKKMIAGVIRIDLDQITMRNFPFDQMGDSVYFSPSGRQTFTRINLVCERRRRFVIEVGSEVRITFEMAKFLGA